MASIFEFFYSTFNLLITVGLIFFGLRMLILFKTKSELTRGLQLFLSAACFFFGSAWVRWNLVLGYLSASFASIELGIRSLGFVLLFASTVHIARSWKR
jgi:hypothetical protein